MATNSKNNPKKIENIGGQAVIEGVMMRSQHFWAVAVRRPNGEIEVKDKKIKSFAQKFKFFKLPIFRGVLALIENLVIGLKALNYSATASTGEKEEPISASQLAISFFFAFVLVLVLFMAIPFYTTKFAKYFIGNKVIFTIVEGFIRIAVFIGYVYVISLIKDIRRVFQYHGAEHKAVNNFESSEALSVENASRYSTIHVRCGTNFVMIVLVIAILVFSFLPTYSFLLRVGGKLILAPIIAGLAYEIIRKASKSKSVLIKFIIKPGLLLQKITTREPDIEQTKVALIALERVLELEKSYG